MVSKVIVNVGRAGAASLDVIQEVEYVKQEAKIVYLLECLQKTAPPVSDSLSLTSPYNLATHCLHKAPTYYEVMHVYVC